MLYGTQLGMWATTFVAPPVLLGLIAWTSDRRRRQP